MKKGHAWFCEDVLGLCVSGRGKVGRSTSGSGDFGRLVVKRESNSGIAGGC